MFQFDSLESRRLLSTVSFLIDSDESFLRVRANAKVSEAGTVKLNEQQDGSGTAALAGSMRIDVNSKGVRFGGGNVIDAVAREGEFDPNGTPADLAVEGRLKRLGVQLATVKAAVRDLVLDITNSSRKPIADQGRFPVRKAEMKVTDGDIDYVIDSRFGDLDGSRSLEGLRTDLENTYATLTGSEGSRTLRVPIEVQYKRKLGNGSSGTFTLKGLVVAHEVIFAEAQILAVEAKPAPRDRVADDVL